MDNIEIKKIIRDGLKRNGMTQVALASMLGIERATVNRWCVGRAIPEADTFLRVCKILQIRIDGYLFELPDTLEAELIMLFSDMNQRQKKKMIKIMNEIHSMIEEPVNG